MSKIHKNRTLGREGKQQQQIIKIIIKKKTHGWTLDNIENNANLILMYIYPDSVDSDLEV